MLKDCAQPMKKVVDNFVSEYCVEFAGFTKTVVDTVLHRFLFRVLGARSHGNGNYRISEGLYAHIHGPCYY